MMPTYFETELALRAAQIRQLRKQNADLVKALETIQSIAKDPGHRTQRTQLQTCRFFDELILPTIEPALTQAGE